MTKRRKIILGIGAIALVSASLASGVVRREIYIARAKSKFTQVHTAAEAGELMKKGAARAWILPNGRWVVACAEHTCCTGAGFAAVVIRDSTGKSWVNRTADLCGGTPSLGMYAGIPEDSTTTTPAEDLKRSFPGTTPADWSEF